MTFNIGVYQDIIAIKYSLKRKINNNLDIDNTSIIVYNET